MAGNSPVLASCSKTDSWANWLVFTTKFVARTANRDPEKRAHASLCLCLLGARYKFHQELNIGFTWISGEAHRAQPTRKR